MFNAAEEYAPTATMADAHREWHLNAGVPMGTPGCPQDACHPAEPEVVAEVHCGELVLAVYDYEVPAEVARDAARRHGRTVRLVRL